jgi:hypothetical protein
MDGRGRRKRVGEATERGFDFIPRPDVRALKDEDTPATPATAPQTVNVNAVAWPTATPGGTPGGKTTLGTPALVPCTPEDEEDDDWEHVHHEDEEPEPVVGELELDLDDPELGLGTAGTPGRKHTYTTVAMAVRNM